MEITNEVVRIASGKMNSEFIRILIANGFSSLKAIKCADAFLNNSLEGIYSHGVNRFPRFIKYVKAGHINPDAEPSLVFRSGSLEQWNGNNGPGPLNAMAATERAMVIAAESGIGLVALANTNHWMRGGTYGWQAVRKGFIFIGWTNTTPNMPAWGASDHRLGNNPLILAVPNADDAIVLDFAMSLYSYGKMELYRNEGRQLPYPGGYSNEGILTSDPVEILKSWRPIPTGMWKGAGLSLLLDIMATVLSGGASSHEIGKKEIESNLSQVFIAIDLSKLSNLSSVAASVKSIIDDYKESVPSGENSEIRYPGENIGKIRTENLKNGIPVNKGLWDKILSL